VRSVGQEFRATLDKRQAPRCVWLRGIAIALSSAMLKLLGSYVLAKLLGFGLIGALVIYALLSLLS